MITKEKLFETIKCEDGDIYNLPFHKKRISNAIGINFNLEEYIYPPTDDLIKCKLVYDFNGIVDVTYTPYFPKDVATFKLVYDDDIIYNKKYLKRDNIDKLYNQRGDSDEIIIVKNGLISDTSIANIAVQIDDIWYTPKSPLLKGTTLSRLIKTNILKEKDIKIGDLKSANKIALLNAMIGMRILTKNNYSII